MRTLPLLITAVALAVSMGTVYAEENSTGAVPKVRKVPPQTAADKPAKKLKVRGAATARTSAEKSKSRKSSSGGDGESELAKAWREADL